MLAAPESGFARRPDGGARIMAVVNITPDSFYDGGRYFEPDSAVERANQCVAEGADIIDLGAESTRPGSGAVDAKDQIDRLLPVIRALRRKSEAILSIDTSHPEVMTACLREGAHMINDVCALIQPGSLEAVSKSNCQVCLMHKQGIPVNMQDNPKYDNVVARVRRYLYGRVVACLEAGIALDRVMIDPGFGFGKNFHHNYTLLAALPGLRFADLPIVVGLSRKSMIGHNLGSEQSQPHQRLEGSLLAAAYAMWRGADIIRTHDVAATRRVLRTATTIAQFHG